MRPDVLVISGPVGVGKTTVAGELSDLLAEQDVAHMFVDVDQLTYTYPRPEGDRFGGRLAHQNLRAMWANAQRLGARKVVLARVVEHRDDLTAYADTLDARSIMLCTLMATHDTLGARVARRELGSGFDWHAARAIELDGILRAADLPGLVVETTDRTPTEIAREILTEIGWGPHHTSA